MDRRYARLYFLCSGFIWQDMHKSQINYYKLWKIIQSNTHSLKIYLMWKNHFYYNVIMYKYSSGLHSSSVVKSLSGEKIDHRTVRNVNIYRRTVVYSLRLLVNIRYWSWNCVCLNFLGRDAWRWRQFTHRRTSGRKNMESVIGVKYLAIGVLEMNLILITDTW